MKEQWRLIEDVQFCYKFTIISFLYCRKFEQEFLGTVKFELDEEEVAISVYLIEDIRGKGYSETVILNSINELCFESPI